MGQSRSGKDRATSASIELQALRTADADEAALDDDDGDVDLHGDAEREVLSAPHPVVPRVSFYERFNGMKIDKEINLSNTSVRAIVKRHAEQVSKCAYICLLVGRFELDAATMASMEKEIMKMLDRAEQRIDRARARIEAVLTAEHISVRASYRNQRTYKAIVISPICNRFLVCAQKTDDTMALLTTAYIEGLMDAATHREECFQVKRALASIIGSMRNFRVAAVRRFPPRQPAADTTSSAEPTAPQTDEVATAEP